MKARSISTHQELLKLKDDWITLFEKTRTENIFISWDWFWIWLMHYGSGVEFFIVIVEDEREIIGIAPFLIAKGSLFPLSKPVIRFLSDDLMADYMDFLIFRNHKEVTGLIINYLLSIRKWRSIILKRIPEWSCCINYLKEIIVESRYKHILRVDCRSPYVKIEGIFNEYFNSVSSNLKQSVRTTMNRLNRMGKVVFERLNGERLNQHLDELRAMHNKRQLSKAGESIFAKQINRDFLSEIASDFLKRDLAEITALKINGKIVSYVYALKCGGRYYCWIQAIDTGYGRFSIGKLHIKFLLQECFSGNIKIFDFMIGDEAYKLQWTKNLFNNYDLRIYNNNLLYYSDRLWFIIYKICRDVIHRYSFLRILRIRLSKILKLTDFFCQSIGKMI